MEALRLQFILTLYSMSYCDKVQLAFSSVGGDLFIPLELPRTQLIPTVQSVLMANEDAECVGGTRRSRCIWGLSMLNASSHSLLIYAWRMLTQMFFSYTE